MATVKRVSASAVNWARLAQHVGPQQAEAMRVVRSKSEALVTSVNSLPEQLPQIDWAAYAKSVPVPGLVDKFRKEYEQLKVPYPKDSEGWQELLEQQRQSQEKVIGKSNQLLAGVKEAAQQYLKDLDEKLPAADEWTHEAMLVYFPGSMFDASRPDITDHPPLPLNKEVPNFNHAGSGLLSKM